MKLTTILGLFAALSSALDIRVTISIDEDLSVSESFNQGSGTCHGIGPLLDKRISSIAPDSGVICTLFEGEDCDGASLPGIIGPFTRNLAQDEFDNRASSMICSSQ